MSDGFFLDDFGLSITIKFKKRNNQPRDISLGTTLEMVFELPDDTTVTKTAAFTTDGKDGKIVYVIESGFITQVGTWKVRGQITEGLTAKYRSDKNEFEVAN